MLRQNPQKTSFFNSSLEDVDDAEAGDSPAFASAIRCHSAAPPHPHCKDPRRRFSKIVCLLLSLNVMRKADVFTLIFALEGAGEAHVTDCALSSAADSGASL